MAFLLPAWAQRTPDSNQTSEPESSRSQGPAREIGGGAGTVGIGAAKGAGHIGEGVAKGAGDVVTLHPVKGATNVVKGTAEGGKDVTVGAAKGTGKIVKGIGKAFKKIF
ncbi:MAG TPA: hypothetical protein VG096_02110 [Bryobacteraceae bacterium]|nr:hypothetical protein [Bryobacteraceae bacterium]